MTLAQPARPQRRRQEDAAAARLERLAGLARALGSVAAVDAAADLVVQAARTSLPGVTAALAIVEDQQLRLLAATGYPRGLSAATRAAMVAPGTPLESAATEGAFQAHAVEHLAPDDPVRFVVAAPLTIDGAAIGALLVGRTEVRDVSASERLGLEAVADVGAQAIARIRLVEAEQRGRQMLVASVEQMPLGVIIVDARGDIVHLNESAKRTWLGSTWPGPVPEGAPLIGYHLDGSRYERHEWPRYRSATTGEVVVDEEITIETLGGERVVIRASSAPVDDVNGRRLGAVVVFADVTDRVRAAAIREAYSGILAHELRTPITSIYGAAELLARRGATVSEENRAVLTGDVKDAALHLLGLVENFLVLSRAEHNATQVDLAPILLQRLAADLVRQESETWPHCTIEVIAPADPLPPVLGDESVVMLMLRNLVGNAAKYAPGRIRIALEPAPDAVRLSVRDHGPGIPSSELVTVFNLFHRSESTARSAPGSGIGLFVVQHLAEAQGGRAWAANLPDGGAEVGFSLPIAGELDVDDQ